MSKIYFIKEDNEEIQLHFTARTLPMNKAYDRTPLSVGIGDITTTINSIGSNKRDLSESKIKLTNINYSISNNSITEPGSITPIISYNSDTIQVIYDNNENITNKTNIEFTSYGGPLTVTPVIVDPDDPDPDNPDPDPIPVPDPEPVA